jgi:membrane protein DedA with SNARE-associated domain
MVGGARRHQPQRHRRLSENRSGARVPHDFFGGVAHYVAQYGYLAVGLGILLEDFGMPTPGETLLITGAILASGGALNIWLLLPIAFIGAVIGDNIGFLIGHTGGHHLMVRYGHRVGITHERFERVEAFFERYGGWVIVFARFVVILRQFNGIVAGTLGMHWLHFTVLNAIGAALWVGFWGMLSYWLGKGILVYLHELHAATFAIGAIIVVALIAGAAYVLRQTRSKRSDS